MSEATKRMTVQEESKWPVAKTFAARAYAAGSATSGLAPVSIQRRAPGPQDVQIEILYCGVCHSDLHQVLQYLRKKTHGRVAFTESQRQDQGRPKTATITPAFKQIAAGLQFPEGPVAMPDGSVILVEIARQTLSRVRPDGTVHVIAHLGGGPNGAATGPGGKIYVTNNGGLKFVRRPGGMFPTTQSNDYAGGHIQVVDPETGKFETLYDACDGRRLRGPNDLVFDEAGGFWFTDLGKRRERDIDVGSVYYAKADGSRSRRQSSLSTGRTASGCRPTRRPSTWSRRRRRVAGRSGSPHPARSSRRTGRTAARRAPVSSGSAATRCSTRWPSTARATSPWPPSSPAPSATSGPTAAGSTSTCCRT
jgi:hypothetical protein